MSYTEDSRWIALTQVLTIDRPTVGAEFIGRHDVIRRLFDMISMPGDHAVILGEPGIGKTSLLNAVSEHLCDAGVAVLRTRTGNGSTFDELVRDAVTHITVAPNDEMRFAPVPPEQEDAEPLSEMLPEGEISVSDLAELLDQQLAGHPVFIVDDYDRLDNALADRAFADLINLLSENWAQATIILCGRGDSADDIHPNHDISFQHLIELPTRLFRPAETLFLIDRIAQAASISFDEDGRKLILATSLGIPNAVQVLAQAAVLVAIETKRDEVGRNEAIQAMKIVANDFDPQMKNAVDAIVGNDPDDEFAQMIFAVAAAHTDWFGRFFRAQIFESVRRRFPEIADEPDEMLAMLDSLCGNDETTLFRKRGSEYRFRDLRIKHYLMMRYFIHRFGNTAQTNLRAVGG